MHADCSSNKGSVLIDLIETYARLQIGGDIRAFLALMLTFGNGAVTPMVFLKLRSERDGTITGDFEAH